MLTTEAEVPIRAATTVCDSAANLAYKVWGSVVHDASCLGALIDRFAQHCHTVDIDADSWRDRNSLKRSSPRKKKNE